MLDVDGINYVRFYSVYIVMMLLVSQLLDVLQLLFHFLLHNLFNHVWRPLSQFRLQSNHLWSSLRLNQFFSVDHLKWVLICLLPFNLFTPLHATSRHTVAATQGDLVIGALFPVHHAPSATQAQTRTCGEIREQYGIHRVEAAFLAIDLINKDNSVLPNITLGIEIRDSCWYSPIALEQSIEFIRDAISASEENKDQANETKASEKEFQAAPNYSPLIPLLKAPFRLAPHLNSTGYCPKSTKKIKNLVGVIGPASSTVTIQVQNLLQLFNIPQIGYSATSRDLSDKNYYKYFLRVVPSDYFQAKVMVDFISSHNWTYISVIYTDGNYGSSLMELFKGLAQEAKICIANTESVFNNAADGEFDNIIRNLQQYSSTAKVVACFCEGMTVRGLLKSIRRLNATGELLIVGSDGWSDRPDVVEDYEREAVGGISVRIHSPYVDHFDPYYYSLKPDNNSRNPWFREFWENKFNCSLPVKLDQPKSPTLPVFNRTCSGTESLADKYKQDTKLAFVMKAIYTMAYGLDSMQRSMCPKTSGLCPDMLPINGSILLQNLLNVSFVFKDDLVEFDKLGDPPGRYDIMNFQKKEHKGSEIYTYIHIGSWDSSGGNFTMMHSIQWPIPPDGNTSNEPPESVCSKPCPKGQAKNIQSDSVKCCWVCVPCRENQYLENEYKCENCPPGWWPNDNLTACNQIPIEYIHWTETFSLIAIGIACIGFIMTFFTMVVFIRHNNTPIVKASTKELSYMILIGMFLSYATTFALISKPTQLTCHISQILPGFSFAVIYASLVTKTNRIARILAGSKKRIITKKPRFMSSGAQVAISLILISIECGIIAFVLVKEPADSKLAYPALDKVQLICNTTTLGIVAPLGFDFFLIVMCTVYAIKTRNVPENFNEAKFIGFTMYTTIVIWIAFVPLYFGSNLKVLTMCLSISFSAIVALVLLFFPKLYIMIFKPEKNNRSFFTTAKNVRCHIGYVPTVGISRHSSHSTSDFSVDSPRNHSLEVYHHYPPHMKRNSGDKLNSHLIREKSSGSSGTGNLKSGTSSKSRKLNFNIFERLRLNKQDKIAANVQRKIRAVRAAEALDRQTNRRGGARMPPRTVTSSTLEASEDSTECQRMRLISFLRHAYGEDVRKIPGFLELVESTKGETRKSCREASAQTSYDLLETWFPEISNRLQKTETALAEGYELCTDKANLLVKSSSVRSRSEQRSRDILQWPSSSDVKSGGPPDLKNIKQLLIGAEIKQLDDPRGSFSVRRMEESCGTQTGSPTKLPAVMKLSSHLGRGKEPATVILSMASTVGTQTPPARRRGSIVSSSASAKVRSSEESLLSGNGSCVIEESASSGGESSPSSGVVYKNIIISLGEGSTTPGAGFAERRGSSKSLKREPHYR